MNRHDLLVTDYVENVLPAFIPGISKDVTTGNESGKDMDVLTQVLGRLGLADVRAFGLSWEDCEELVHLLGHRLQVQLVASA